LYEISSKINCTSKQGVIKKKKALWTTQLDSLTHSLTHSLTTSVKIEHIIVLDRISSLLSSSLAWLSTRSWKLHHISGLLSWIHLRSCSSQRINAPRRNVMYGQAAMVEEEGLRLGNSFKHSSLALHPPKACEMEFFIFLNLRHVIRQVNCETQVCSTGIADRHGASSMVFA
jgi:hypothetical protein